MERKCAGIWPYCSNIICNLAGFCKCLPEYTVHNLVILIGLAYRIGVVEQCCQIVQYCIIFLNGVLFNLVCRKNFVTHHREIGAIWCYFKDFNTILNSENLLNLLHKMTYVTDKFQLCFCFAFAALNSYILCLPSQHSWHLCRQLATYALSCLCILVSKSAWRHRYRWTCN